MEKHRTPPGNCLNQADSKIYIAPMDGFETYLKAALIKKNVPVSVVADQDTTTLNNPFSCPKNGEHLHPHQLLTRPTSSSAQGVSLWPHNLSGTG